jgi:putative endonuclease
MKSQSLGRIGEAVAANYLLAQGYEIITTNFFNKRGYKFGEIDIIVRDKHDKIIFVEVKARKGKEGEVVPEESVTNQKLTNIVKTAQHFLSKHELMNKEWRIDLITIILDFSVRKMQLRHIKAIHF